MACLLMFMVPSLTAPFRYLLVFNSIMKTLHKTLQMLPICKTICTLPGAAT